MGHQRVAAGQAQRVQKLRAAKRLAQNLRLHGGVVVVHHVIGAQQHIAFAAGVAAGQGALVQVGQLAQGRLRHHVVAALHQRGGGKNAVADEVGNKAGGRAVVEGVGVVPLVQMAFVHHANHVTDRKGLQLVVRDKQRRRSGGLQDVAHLVRQALAQIDIEVGKRLVQQHELRARGQRPRQRHALLLPARELVRKPSTAAFQPHQLQGLGHARSLLGPGQLVDAESHVALHAQVRKQGVVLEHHANAPRFGRHIQLRTAHQLALEADLAGRHGLEPRHGAQQRGLAAARGADQHADIARTQPQRDALHRCLGTARVTHFELGNLKKHGLILVGRVWQGGSNA